MSLNIYISLLDLILLLPLGSSVYLKDERVSCKCWWSNILHPSERIWLEQMEPPFFCVLVLLSVIIAEISVSVSDNARIKQQEI